jgi:diguanylate cyclase (GGDEF)-like protein/PAS domain S-box-containing protein
MEPSSASGLSAVETLRAFVATLREGVYITSQDGRILDANPAFLAMFGVASLAELVGVTASQLLVHPKRRVEELELLARDSTVREFELEIRRPDGGTRTVLDTAFQVTDPTTGEVRYHGILVDISERKGLEEQLREAAIRDPLTGCYNRRFLADIESSLGAAGGSWGTTVIDLDHFKEINDRYGHDVGDQMLVRTTRFLLREVRAEDVLVRMGGDEFLLVLAGADVRTTQRVARRLRRRGPSSAPTRFTLGWAVRDHGERLEQTVRRADRSLIRARQRERGVPPVPPARRRRAADDSIG